MTRLITTTVVRASQQGESHGGAYLIDLEAQDVRQVIDWTNTDIDWRGHGGDRGLRGVAIDGQTVYIVTSDELIAFTPDFQLIGSWRNPYLKHAHGMSIYERSLYIVSGAFDSVLAFQLDQKKFFWALHIDLDRFDYSGSTYDPDADDGPLQISKLHLNSVHANENGMYLGGLRTDGMLHFNGEAVYMSVTLPEGIRDARPFRDGVLFNDTEADAVRYASRSGEEDRAVSVPAIDRAESVDDRIARAGFARGLCPINERVVVAGSSPATLSLHDLRESKTLGSVTLHTDIRHAIHSVELWPF